MKAAVDLARYHAALEGLNPLRQEGRVVQVVGLGVEVEGLTLQVGDICHIYSSRYAQRLSAEVVGFRGNRLILVPYGEVQGIQPGAAVLASRRRFSVPVGRELLGRVVDGFCRPIDDRGPLTCAARSTMTNTAPHPLARATITEPLETGIRAIDGLLTVGKGQRIGIFSGSGVGKSTIIAMIARHARSDVNVIALIGERGREVHDFVESHLREEGLANAVVVVSTSDQPALLRLKGAWVATTIAEYFRDQGLDVVLLMDSVTRFAMAQREIGLTAGEPPSTKGYPPSVFALLPRLMERTGTSQHGSITSFYTVLMEGDDPTEPITDTARSILDGHVVLTRDLARANHFPAIDVLDSVSRIMLAITSAPHREAAGRLRSLLATYRDARDLVNTGAYQAGSNAEIDEALRLLPAINAFLRQPPDEFSSYEDTKNMLHALFARSEADG